ncbi:uncharacterized protein LOC106141435 [Rhizophagus clarus]|uniref:Uncharacterized protein LOC106141435 n=1 Tax=Rhizophagus clarus TaxID=94130 RepID=A0A8H3QAX5_9GLOM|nr:uncharacterized protein LOC106141435 [Rhizophagus clarus]
MLQNYMQPRHPATKEVQHHHHPSQIQLAAIGRNEMNSHVDEHYCLAAVKGVKMFALTFPQDIMLISQDDKAKVPLGMAAIGQTFKAIQTINEFVSVPDHDFPKASKHKLIPSVYLLINPSNSNNSLCSSKVQIFIRLEYFLGTSCKTHMVDLMSITKEEPFHEFTHNEDSVKPFWCLLTDGGPDENPRFLVNISKYLLLFKKLDLDYLTVWTYMPKQSAYNLVEQSMISLSGKLAGIELDVFAYGHHLGSINEKVTIINDDLGCRNFKHVGKRLCELWSHDQINGHPVITTYVEKHDWTDFLDIEEDQPRAPEIYNILSTHNGFLPPVIKGHDRHYLNLVHTLEYFGEKLSGYDEHYSTFLKLHVKMTHSNEKTPKRRITSEETESLLRDYGSNVKNTKDNKSLDHKSRNIQILQEEKTKKGKGRPRQQNLTAKPWE